MADYNSTTYNTYQSQRAGRSANRVDLAKPKGDAYIVSVESTVAAGGTLNLQLQNPEENDVCLNVDKIQIGTQFAGQINVYDRFDSITAGSAVTPQNLRLDAGGETNPGTMSVSQDATITPNSTHLTAVIPSGGAAGKTGGGVTEGEPFIAPSRQIVVEVTNDSGSSAPASIGIVYTEGELP